MSNLSGSGTLKGVLGRGGGGAPQDVYWDNILNKPDFAAVATSGSYNDLLDKPPAPSVMIGATAQSNGAAGYAPQPLAGDQNKFLNGAGEWVTPQSSGVNYSTDEQIVGTWVNGKPLYQKTFSGIYNLTNSWLNTGEVIPNGIIVKSEAVVYESDGNSLVVLGNISPNGEIFLYSLRSGTTYHVNYFTIWYTKLTD